MQIPIHIIDFLKSTSDISIGRNKINFFNAEELKEKQVGYNFYLYGESNELSLYSLWPFDNPKEKFV